MSEILSEQESGMESYGPKFQIIEGGQSELGFEILESTSKTTSITRRMLFLTIFVIGGLLGSAVITLLSFALNMSDLIFAVLIAIVLYLVLGLAMAIERSAYSVPKYAMLATLRYGNRQSVRGPGLVILMPFGFEVIDEVIDMRGYPIAVAANLLPTREGWLVNLGVNAKVAVSPENPGKSVFEEGDFWQMMIRDIENATLEFVKIHTFFDLKGKELDEEGNVVPPEQVREEQRKLNQTFLEIAQEIIEQDGGIVSRIRFSDVQLADKNLSRILISPKARELIAEGRVRGAKRTKEVLQELKRAIMEVCNLDEKVAGREALSLMKLERISEMRGGSIVQIPSELYSEESESDFEQNPDSNPDQQTE